MKTVSKIGSLTLAGGLAATLGTPVLAQGGDAPPIVNTGSVTWSAGADVVSTYIFRGFELEDSGLILQPYVEVGAPIGDTGIDFYMGQWNSIHSEETGAVGLGPDAWYESDFYAGVSLGLTDKVGLDVSYVGYFYPNGNFDDIHELDIAISYDDSDDLGDWSVSPYALVAIELKDDNGSEDVYLELGGELSLDNIVPSEDLPVSLSVPFAIGLSLDDYYGDEDFGFLSVGVMAGMPLDFIPSDLGVWEAYAGVTGYWLNDDVAGLTDGDDDYEIVLSAGFGLEY